MVSLNRTAFVTGITGQLSSFRGTKVRGEFLLQHFILNFFCLTKKPTVLII